MDAELYSICICTFRRPDGLRRLLDSLTRLVDAPPFEVVVVDNDPAGSAQAVASAFTPQLLLRYVAEPAPCLATARNRSIREARGATLAFVDDDEEVVASWLATHHRVLAQYGAAATSGPARFIFDDRVPAGIRQCRMFNRHHIPEGQALPWYWAFTGNACIRRAALPHPVTPFQEHFGTTGGEDVDCFKKIEEAGGRLVACGDGALVREYRDYERARYAWVVRRALRNGGNLADLQWSHHPRGKRMQLAFQALGQGLREAVQARRLARVNSLAFVEKSIDAGMSLGRFLCVFGYRYAEYGVRR